MTVIGMMLRWMLPDMHYDSWRQVFLVQYPFSPHGEFSHSFQVLDCFHSHVRRYIQPLLWQTPCGLELSKPSKILSYMTSTCSKNKTHILDPPLTATEQKGSNSTSSKRFQKLLPASRFTKLSLLHQKAASPLKSARTVLSLFCHHHRRPCSRLRLVSRTTCCHCRHDLQSHWHIP